MTGGPWASLFSGGKDSSWALYRALETGREVTRLVTVHPAAESYLYHTPATEVTRLAADSIGIPLVEIESDITATDTSDSSLQGDRELEPLETKLQDLTAELRLTGVTAGAIASSYQETRLRAMCDRLGIELFAPLWGGDPIEIARAMLDAGFEITIIQVAAGGLDASWLGRTLDEPTLTQLTELNADHGVHILGEGGEYETLVTNGPHMDRRIEFEYETEWDGTRGRVRITDAWLS